MENLFIESGMTFEKVASEVTLPEDPNTWSNEILQEIYKQAPFITDFEPHVVMDRVDAEKGYGFGHFEIGNKTAMQPTAGQDAEQAAGVRKVRIPIIVKLNKLQPLDVLVTEDSKMLPLTESRLRQALFRPQAFDISSQTPGDQSMIGQLYPPFRQNYGFGGGGVTMSAGMGKEGSAPSLLSLVLASANGARIEKVAAQIAEDPDLQAAYLDNSYATAGALATLASASTDSTEKVAFALPNVIKADVVQLTKEPGGYLLKTANHQHWAPITQHLDRGQAVDRFGSKIVLAADLNESVTVAEGPEVSEEDPEMQEHPQLIADYGIYKVHDTEGNELVGYVFPNLIDLTGSLIPLALFTNGSQAAVQGEIVGTHVGEGAALPTGHPRGYGVFYRIGPDGAEATIPFDLHGSISEQGEVSMAGTSFDGSQVNVMFNQPNLEKITSDGSTVMVPESFQWLPLNKSNEVALASNPEEATAKTAARRELVSVTVRSHSYDSHSFEGFPVEKLASAQRTDLSIHDALFLLAGLGVEATYGQQKLAQSMYEHRPVQIRIGRMVKSAGAVRQEMLKKAHASLENFPFQPVDLVKEAAAIPDPTAVDTVLSLGFLNEENLSHFVSYLPKIDEAQEKMCEILIASRLGLQAVPSGAVERAVRSVEEVVEGLRVLAFQQG